ncbi:hypothetical protein [Alcanivorax sp. DP30]|uniref:hypothetical protein n=1 Tax=Alcanivorax sp. DP30 TaxID=2606217 RepID=UPI001368AAF3|nr:hypothetical protein [Alcanivorax sp. DP30]MZR62650.1 hypothetical protein [Alcanivorax sp. DP30]
MLENLFRKKRRMRVLPDQSTREITDAKARLGTELRAALYLYNEDKFIVCSIAGISEFGDPVVLDANATDEALGLALCDKLLAFRMKNDQGLSKLKLDDWSAYKASGAKTGKAFEKKCIYVYVRTVNSAINIEAAPRISNEKELKALCSISNGRKHSEIGAAVRKAIGAATLLRNAGML